MKRFFLILAAVSLLTVPVFSAPAIAQVMELDAIVVEGRIQRPQASYILQRASVDIGLSAKRRSFVGKIVESIEKDPF